jgi:hypothetical protein
MIMEGAGTIPAASGVEGGGGGGEDLEVATSLDWTQAEVVALTEALIAEGGILLPIGVSKHFNMIGILRRFEIAIKRKVDVGVLWERLNDCFDMPKLDTIVNCPWPNEQVEFSLPDSDFNQLIQDRKSQSSADKLFDDESRDSGSGRETPPTLPIAKRGASQSTLASSATKRKYSSSFSETGSEGGGTSTGRKSTSASSTAPGSANVPKTKRRI